jgi:CelD/BcsL family acetyltransferase involved in cellulose biosynthesis
MGSSFPLAASLTPSASPRSQSRLHVEELTDENAAAALAPEWQALEERAENTLPFRTAAWTLAWWKHLRRDSLAIRDRLSIYVFRAGEGELAGVAPLMLTESPGAGPLRTRCLQFVGADPNITELRGPLFDPMHEDGCFRALEVAVTERAGRRDWMAWSGVPVHQAPLLDRAITWERSTPYYVLELHGDLERFRSGLPRNIRESLRKCYNSLRRDGLEHDLEVVKDPCDVKSALGDFFRLHGARAAQRGTVPHPDVFATGASRAFLVDVCGRFADRGELRIFRLRVGEQVVAVRVGFVLGGSLYLYYSGYDTAFAKYSVMTTTVFEAISYAFGQGFTSVNLSTGNDVSKTRWRPLEIVEHAGVTNAGNPRARLAHGAYQAAARLAQSGGIRARAHRIASRLFSRE